MLEGSVRRDSDKVRINAQLIQVKDQVPLWSRQYDRELSHLLALQGEIAHDVGDEILFALGDGRNQANGPAPRRFCNHFLRSVRLLSERPLFLEQAKPPRDFGRPPNIFSKLSTKTPTTPLLTPVWRTRSR